MKLSRPTSETLFLATASNRTFIALGALLMIIGLVLFAVQANITTLELRRQGGFGIATVTEAQLFHSRIKVHMPTRWIRGATVERASFMPLYAYHWLELDVRDGLGPYKVAWYRNGAQARRAARRIDRFLAGQGDAHVSVQADQRPESCLLGTVLVLLGLGLAVWGSQTIRSTFDRARGLVEVRRRSWIGGSDRTLVMSQVTDMVVAGWQGDCQLFLVLADGRRVQLSHSVDPEAMVGPSRIREARLATAAQIQEFCAG